MHDDDLQRWEGDWIRYAELLGTLTEIRALPEGDNPARRRLSRSMTSNTLIFYRGELVAVASQLRVHLAGELSAAVRAGVAGADDPIARFVYAMGSYARDIAAGELVGPYSGAAAERYARTLLIPDEEFMALSVENDEALAVHFCVPLEQIPRKRRDLHAIDR